MSSELTILGLYGLLIILLILIETFAAVLNLGLPYMSSPRDERRDKSGLAGRAERGVINCTIGMALFAPAILALAVKDAFTATTLMLAQIYLAARVVYVVVYLAGIPLIRTLSFVVALTVNVLLYYLAL